MWSRRGFLAITAGVALTAACGPRPGEVASDGSVTVRHVFGETRIPAPPTRVVSAGLTEQDDLLAVGVVPIAVTEWFGGEQFAVWPWARPRLGDAQPVVLSLDDGIQVDRIAELSPDLIVATNAGLDRGTYERLSQIAPTIAQSGRDAFFEPWRDQATIIGQAVFKNEEMQQVIADVEERFAAVDRAHGEFAGKTVLLLEGRLDDGQIRPLTPRWRSDFLTAMGFSVPDHTDPQAADVLIWTTETDEDRAALEADPTVAPHLRRSVFTDRELAAAIAFGSPLSYPVVADRLPPLIAPVLG